MAADGVIRIEICYARPDGQAMAALTLPAGTTVREALDRSGFARRYPDINPDTAVLGIRGKRVPPEHPLAEGDRVEILRPLTADPKETRRRLAARGKTMSSAPKGRGQR